jgi:hypothetical protein
VDSSLLLACAAVREGGGGDALQRLVGRWFSLYGHFMTPSFRQTFFMAVAQTGGQASGKISIVSHKVSTAMCLFACCVFK